VPHDRDDFTRRPERYDVVDDNVATHGLSHLRRVQTRTGTLVPNANTGRWLGGLGPTSRFPGAARCTGGRASRPNAALRSADRPNQLRRSTSTRRPALPAGQPGIPPTTEISRKAKRRS
jgi:hypothetical protein